MELEVQKYLRKHGLEKTVNDFSLAAKPSRDGRFVLFKYDQIESPMSEPIVQECRGLILDSRTWDVVSMPFTKFFNHGEPNAHQVVWERSIVYKKYDGSLLSLYNVDGEWRVSTTGTPDADANVNNREDMTFRSLFFSTMSKYCANLDILPKDCTYMFELCTPYNIVVTPHPESMLVLLGARHIPTLTEFAPESLEDISKLINVPVAESYSFASPEDVEMMFNDMPFHEEGYVVMDQETYARIKIKNPSYVAAHHLKSSTAEWKIVAIIKKGEVDEYSATFPEREEEIRVLAKAYEFMLVKLEEGWDRLIKMPWRKDYAMSVQSECTGEMTWATGMYFSLMGFKEFREHIKKSVLDMDERRLYGILKNISEKYLKEDDKENA